MDNGGLLCGETSPIYWVIFVASLALLIFSFATTSGPISSEVFGLRILCVIGMVTVTEVGRILVGVLFCWTLFS